MLATTVQLCVLKCQSPMNFVRGMRWVVIFFFGFCGLSCWWQFMCSELVSCVRA